jgi:hypothetical protein
VTAHRRGAGHVWGCLLAGTTKSLNYSKRPPAPALIAASKRTANCFLKSFAVCLPLAGEGSAQGICRGSPTCRPA